MEPSQTSQSQQVVKQREHELQVAVFNNRHAPGMQEMLEYARIQAVTAHTRYLRHGISEELRQRELVWLSVAQLIENGPTIKEGVNNAG